MTIREEILAVVDKGNPVSIHELEAEGLERNEELQVAMRDLVRDGTIESKVDVVKVKATYTKVVP